MRLSRRQSIFASLAILVLFFSAVALLRPSSRKNAGTANSPVETSQQENPPAPAAGTAGNTDSSSSDFVLDDFRREEIKDGKKIWEVKATRGRYNPSAGRAMLENALLWLYQKEGGIVTLKANKVTLKLEGAESLSSAEFSGDVVIVQDNKMTLQTDQASYDKARDMITAPNLVRISGEKMNLEGIGMEVLVSSKDIKLLKQTKTLLEEKSAAGMPERAVQ